MKTARRCCINGEDQPFRPENVGPGFLSLCQLGIADDDPRVNPNGGAIALGHPLGMSGARITGTAALQLALAGGRRSLLTMGVGQGIAITRERAWLRCARRSGLF